MLPQEVSLPPGTRPVGGLLAAARPLDGEWWRGITFRSDGCVAPVVRGPCTVDQTDESSRPSGTPYFAPITIRQGAKCSTLSGSDMEALAAARLDQTREWAMGRELQTGGHTNDASPGAGSGNPFLDDAVQLVADRLPIIDALACVEQHAADELFGITAFVHASPLVATHLKARSLMWRDGRLWRTVTGNVVVVSPGYQGDQLYVTSEVFAATGQRTSPSTEVDRKLNTSTAWADELGVAAFDPCWFGRVSVDVALCTATPGGGDGITGEEITHDGGTA